MKNKIITLIQLLILVFFASCNKTEFDVISADKLMGDSLSTTYTIDQLITEFDSNYDAYTDTTNYKGGLFTVKQILSPKSVVISGVVTSSDIEGNVYKNLIIQEMRPSGKAMRISIDASGLSGIYPLGQKVWIKCNNLYLGKYAQSYQIGTLFKNYERSIKKRSIDSLIYRMEPGRIAMPIAMNVIHAYGKQDLKLVKADTLTIAQIKSGGVGVLNKLVCIKNAYFTGRGSDFNKPAILKFDADYIFAPSTNGVGFPQSREIQDGTGSVFISTSEYSRFAKRPLPGSQYKGNITAIVGWYNDKKTDINPTKITTEIYHQLTLRSLKDLGKGFENYHLSLKEN